MDEPKSGWRDQLRDGWGPSPRLFEFDPKVTDRILCGVMVVGAGVFTAWVIWRQWSGS